LQCRGYFKKEMPNHRVFLAIDNVLDDLIEQAKTYLGAHYREESIIMFTARSIDVLSKCLKIKESDCLEIPEINETEAKSLFLKQAENSLYENFEINKQNVNACLQKCLFSKPGINRGFQYHPLALKILGTSGYDPQRYSKQLSDTDIFNPNRIQNHPIFSILRTSYDSLIYEDQLLFLDVAIFVPIRISTGYKIRFYWNFIEWLCMMHKSSIQGMKKQVRLSILFEYFHNLIINYSL
jgi:dsDNA-binding SOS-regulon protein